MRDVPPVINAYKVARQPQGTAPRRVMPPRLPKPRVSHGEAIFRTVVVLVIVISTAAAYWSFFHGLIPLQKQTRELTTRISTMSSRVDQMERRWPKEQVEEIRQEYRKVYAQLFADEAALEEWLGAVQSQAQPLSLGVQVAFGKSEAQSQFSTNLAVIPASITLAVEPVASDEGEFVSPYSRVVRFGQQLSTHGKRADLAELNVSGGVESIQQAVLTFNLWAGDLGADATPEKKP